MECVIGIFNGIVIKDYFWLMEPADTPVVVVLAVFISGGKVG